LDLLIEVKILAADSWAVVPEVFLRLGGGVPAARVELEIRSEVLS